VRALATALLVGVGALLALTACGAPARVTVAPCRGDAVTVTAGQFGVGRGHFGGALLFSNVGPTTCSLRGYPTVLEVLEGAGRDVAVASTPRGYLGGLLPGATAAPTVTLVPHGVASAILEGTAVAASRGAACARVRSLLVGMPGSIAGIALAIETSACSHLEVHPVVAGRTGDQAP
jgi:uncharacterized protein DUF4232